MAKDQTERSDPRGVGDGRVSVNTAPASELDVVVDGIGPVLAERIVTYRSEHGPFSSLDDLVQISGIGPVLLEHLRDQLALGEGEGMAAPTREAPQAADSIVDEGGDVDEVPDNKAESPNEETTAGATREAPDAIVPWSEMLPEPDVSASETAQSDSELSPETGGGETESAAEAASPVPEDMDETESTEEEPVDAVVEDVAAAAEEDDMAVGEAGLEMDQRAAAAKVEAEQPERSESVAEPQVQIVEHRRSGWQGVLLVLLGGIAGVVLTLLVAVIWTGTIQFAPRAEVDALSRNLDTVYGNQELAWERIDELVARANELEGQVGQLQTLEGQMQTLEGHVEEAQGDVAQAREALGAVKVSLGSLEEELASSVGELDQRVGVAEGSLAEMSGSLDALEETFAEVESDVAKFDGFFGSLRDLLVEMQGMPEGAE